MHSDWLQVATWIWRLARCRPITAHSTATIRLCYNSCVVAPRRFQHTRTLTAIDAHIPIVLNDAALQHLVRRCNNGEAGGPSGWNGAMLATLVDCPTCMQGLCSIISDITLGRIPPAVRPHITAPRLTALAQPNGDPRPIAMGELFYRLSAVRALRSVSAAARTLLAPHQCIPPCCYFASPWSFP